MKHQQVVPDYAAMVQTSGTVLCLVFSGWVLFRLIHAVFWLPGYLEKTQGSLYERLEKKADQTVVVSDKKHKAKDSDAEEEDDGGDEGKNDESNPDVVEHGIEKGNDDANEQEKDDVVLENKKDN